MCGIEILCESLDTQPEGERWRPAYAVDSAYQDRKKFGAADQSGRAGGVGGDGASAAAGALLPRAADGRGHTPERVEEVYLEVPK